MAEEEKPEILKDYTLIKDIGEGNFGKVKLSTLNSTNEKYAIKILNKEKLKQQTKSSSFNEIEIISKLNHPNIIHVEKILEDNKNHYIIMEYCDKGELFDYIVTKDKLEQIEAAIFFYQLINGVEYLHKKGFVHRDLKPENLLLTKDKILKIIDFGLCHDFNGTKLLKSKCGSPSYAAPEILKGFPYDGFKTDIWCCGITLYAMLCGYLPFDGDDNQEIFRQIVECSPDFPPFLGDDSINLLIGLLNPDPKRRLTISQIKSHPFYLKGKDCFLIQYDDIYDDDDDDNNINEEEENEINENYKVNDPKKKIGFSSVRKLKDDNQIFNNIQSIKIKKNKNFKSNIYDNIFTNIIYDDESNDSNDRQIGNKNIEKDKESDKYDKAKKRKINQLSGLANNNNNNNNKNNKFIQTEQNQEYQEDKTSFLARILKNKLKDRKLKFDSNKLFFYNKNSINKKTLRQNYHSSSLSTQKTKETNVNNEFSSDARIDSCKSTKRTKNEKVFFTKREESHKSKGVDIIKLLNEKNNNNFKDKINNKELKLKTDNLNFFQKFLINKNKTLNDTSEKSPLKTHGINFNLVLTKNKERNKNKNLSSEENRKDRHLSEKKNSIHAKCNILFSQKRKKCDTVKKTIAFINKSKSPNSPYANPKNNYFQRNNNFNKHFDSIYGNDIIQRKLTDNIKTRTSYGWRSCLATKRRGKKMKFNMNKRFDIKITNLNSGPNTLKKEGRKYFVKSFPSHKKEKIEQIVMSKNQVLNEAFKTEPKYNHFLDKVIKKINSKKEVDKSQKTITCNNINNKLIFNRKFKNEEEKHMINMLNFEKNNKTNSINNNKENMGCPFLINYNKNNEKAKLKAKIHLKGNKKFLLNPKILEKKLNSKNKIKRIFPNLATNN